MNKFASSRTTRTLVIIGGLLGLVLMSNPHSTQAATRSTQFSSDNFYCQPLSEDTAAITGYTGPETTVSIPDTVTKDDVKYKVVNIAASALANKNLAHVTIPATVTTIGDKAFSRNNLDTVIFEEDSALTTIGNDAFSLNKMETIILPDSVETVVNSAFEENQLEEVTLSSRIKTLGDSAFKDNKIEYLNFNEALGLTAIGTNAFTYNKLQEVEIPENVATIGANAFMDNKLLQITLNTSGALKLIGDKAFYNNQIDTVQLPDSAAEIGKQAFSDNRLTAVDTVTTDQAATDIKIDDQAFYNNQLTQLSLADQVSQIGASAFSHNQLTKVTLPQGLIQLGDEAFSDNHLTQVTLPRLDALTSGTTIFTRQTNVIDANTLTKSNQLALTDLIQLTSDSTKATYAQVTSITDGVTYNQETGMFTIPEGTTEFDFRLAKLAFDPNDSLYISGNYTADLDGVDVPETENPDTGGGGGGQPDTGQPEGGTDIDTNTPGTITPLPETATEADTSTSTSANKYPYMVYAKRGLYLYKSATFATKNRVKAYAKKTRAKAPTFKILGTARSANGVLRYKVKGGYITANKNYVAGLYYALNTKSIKVLSAAGINSYKTAKLSKSDRVKHYRKNTILKVKRIVKQGKVTRYQLTNGRYVSANKQLVIWN